jgi:aminoglycoside phosphotransferase (APT) family kinase protein
MLDEIRTLFPALAARTATRIDGGWTCETYDVDATWIVQFARSPYAIATQQTQLRVLPELAARVRIAVPVPVYASADPHAIAYRKLAGMPADAVPGGPWPEQLGQFLAGVHSLAPEELGLLASEPTAIRKQARAEFERLHAIVVPRLEPRERMRAEALLARYLDDDDNWRFVPAVTHGDLAFEHVLVDSTGALAGVIDWESIAVRDPVWDLAGWLLEQSELGARLLAAYGELDSQAVERARYMCALGPWHGVEHWVASGDPASIKSSLAVVRARLS